jgi:hypothetical protein
MNSGGNAYSIYQPLLDSWDYYNLRAHAAVSVLPGGAQEPVFGSIEITANTFVDRVARTVSFTNIKVTRSYFPSAVSDAQNYGTAFQSQLATGRSTMSLDRLEQALAADNAQKKAKTVPVQNNAPRFIFSFTPKSLVLIDGAPIWQPVAKTSLSRVINTRALILKDDKGTIYMHVLDGFISSASLDGPWALATPPPRDADSVARDLASKNIVDLMQGQEDPGTKKRPSLAAGVPGLMIATAPTELIVFDGQPQWVPVEETNLLYAKNTTGNVFKNISDQTTFILVTGRWFRAPSFYGPYEFLAGKDLPADFSRIPDTNDKENVKASVPGTPQAAESVIAASIPQTAEIDRTKATFTVVVTGAPELKPIQGTTLQYVFNAPYPIIMVSPTQWYALKDAVWFFAPSMNGPWTAAIAVPGEIYAIPPSSPLYYVTYVRIYGYSTQYVVVGYYPGYTGVVVTPDGTVVYGTGYVYPVYVGVDVYYPAPVTYGYAVCMAWTPWTGWAMGFGFGMAMGAMFWGPAPYWGGAAWGYHGAAVWGPGGWAATSGNVYHQWGSTGAVTRTSGGYNAWTGNAWSNQVAHSYNSTTGRMSSGQRGTVENVYTGNYAHDAHASTYNTRTGASASATKVTVGNAYTGNSKTIGTAEVTGPGGQSKRVVDVNGNYYSDHDGNVYRYNSQSGNYDQHQSGGGWSEASPEKSQSLDSQSRARQAGDQRSAGSSWAPDNAGGSWGGEENRGGGSERGGYGGYSSGGYNSGGGWDRGGGGGGGKGGEMGGGEGAPPQSTSSWGGGKFRGGGGGRR